VTIIFVLATKRVRRREKLRVFRKHALERQERLTTA